MSTIDEIINSLQLGVAELPDRQSPDGEPEMMLVTAAELREIAEPLITAALADARRDGAEEMREKAACGWDGCMYDAPGEAIDIGADIRALPLPDAPTKPVPVLLTDEQALAAMPDCHGSSLGKTWMLNAARAIESAVLAANGLGVGK